MIEYYEWIGSACGIAGAALIASNVRLSPWGWWLFLVSSLSLCAYGVAVEAWGILALNVCFVLTNITGIVRVWLPYYCRTRPFTVKAIPLPISTKQV
ncbi:hypothetical protein [Stutzerimonas stutzeri]|uniref:hypothetical protein n=1 Tax=Stutzerimonas stutzeri TaxID=316 RepID=UPI0015E3D5B8|nr:hypothetical protein [Stutzerimonas stutzeri]MBA1280432.1 hypothetical protein [Stutzerimonas stutzeri]